MREVLLEPDFQIGDVVAFRDQWRKHPLAADLWVLTHYEGPIDEWTLTRDFLGKRITRTALSCEIVVVPFEVHDDDDEE